MAGARQLKRKQDFARARQTSAPAAGGDMMFIGNSRQHDELAFDSGAVAFGASFGPRDLPAIGYLRDVFLDINASGGTGAGAVGSADAPFNIFTSIQLIDISGATLVDVSSFDLFLINLLGGYRWSPDPRNWPFFSAIAGTGGNFRWQAILPAELLADAYGALANENAASSLKLRYQQETSGNFFTTPPATLLPTIDTRGDIDVWTRPIDREMDPPGLGTSPYWSKQIYPTVAGANTIKLTRVGAGPIHTFLLVFRSSAGARYDLSTITDFQIAVDGVPLRGPTTVLKLYTEMFQNYGFGPTVAAGVTSGYLMGVMPFSYRTDVGHPDRGDSGQLWFPTTGATRLEVRATLPAGGAGGTLQVLTGDVVRVGARHTLAVS